MNIVSLTKINKIYNPGKNEIRALFGVDLDISNGDFVSIIGSSGSGKSTLLNIIGCLDAPDGGEYLLNGRNVGRLRGRQLAEIRSRQIGFVFQSFNLIPTISAFENVELPLVYKGLGKEKRRSLAKAALERVGLQDRKNHRPGELSGGQQQRAAIARAIAGDPAIILADEPTGNLDTNTGRDVMNLLCELNGEGKTIILITHDDKIAAKTKRQIRIADGRIV